MIIYIKVGSITNAQRAQRILKSHGYKAQIKRESNPSKKEGCGYVVAVKDKNNEAIEILKKADIKIKGVERI